MDDDVRLGVLLPTGKAQWGPGTDPLEALRTVQVVVAGSVSEVRERLRPYVDGGARHLVCRIAALDLRTQYQQLELIRSIA
ncbi:hypothetical protein HH310_40260 [Actinoplanes sp. TBRC 11911]|uniref:hypothetical protein n=1 Tax=Actinoplanes sp. TBRC 11911 TaxID=2729386 RepID=UPI00145F1CFF|nr:hypothetical protein [Actinoplanes sp. TBRC 11911]NMO57393.1 hypothetical protein [Actinoplanes sp. TBRC 11911]